MFLRNNESRLKVTRIPKDSKGEFNIKVEFYGILKDWREWKKFIN